MHAAPMHDASLAPESVTHRTILRRAWPIILTNATVPLIGLVDTAVIGNLGSATDLGAIALGSLVFSFLYFGLGFLRMSTTGFIAQAAGAGDEAQVLAVLLRGLGLAALIGLSILLLKRPLELASLQLLHGSAPVEQSAGQYVRIRLWSAPATLCTHVVRGALIGLGHSRQLLLLETSLNALQKKSSTAAVVKALSAPDTPNPLRSQGSPESTRALVH